MIFVCNIAANHSIQIRSTVIIASKAPWWWPEGFTRVASNFVLCIVWIWVSAMASTVALCTLTFQTIWMSVMSIYKFIVLRIIICIIILPGVCMRSYENLAIKYLTAHNFKLEARYLLCEANWFGDRGTLSLQQRLDKAYDAFKSHCKQFSISCSQKNFMVKYVADLQFLHCFDFFLW